MVFINQRQFKRFSNNSISDVFFFKYFFLIFGKFYKINVDPLWSPENFITEALIVA